MLITLSSLVEPRYLGSLTSVANEQHMHWLWDFSGRMPFWIGKYIGCKFPLQIAVPVHVEKYCSSSSPVFKHCIILKFLLLLLFQHKHKPKAIIYLVTFISFNQKDEFIMMSIAGLFVS